MKHVPVLLDETISSLQLAPGMRVIDCTLGDAGHSEAMLEKISPNGMLLGVDADPEAVLRAKRFLYRFEDRAVLVRENFVHIASIAVAHNFTEVQGVLMDFGWSTPQFEERGRGFSFLTNEPLDMRYSAGEGQTAAEIVNTYSEHDLYLIFKMLGEEQLSAEIAAAIVFYRKNKQIETTGELTEIILSQYRKKLKTDKEVPWVGGIHPATKVFQALRIEANQELESIKKVLPEALELLAPHGRLAVITFHSLEDRIVKQYFKSQENKKIRLVNKKPIVAGEEELKNNPRARSAKLRVVEKI